MQIIRDFAKVPFKELRICNFGCGAKEAIRPRKMSSIHSRALAIAVSRASRLAGFIAGFAVGACTMPFTAAKLLTACQCLSHGTVKFKQPLDAGAQFRRRVVAIWIEYAGNRLFDLIALV
jgi:hypothetical protein